MKRVLAIFLSIVMILSFASCGKKEDAQKELTPEEIEKEREEEIKKDPTANLKLTLDEWPVIDGATAMLPYYEEAAARILDMPVEEARLHVLCSTTDTAYDNLANGVADLVFCAPPSQAQVNYAASLGVEYESKQVLNSGFVFFVNKNNPVDNISSQQLHDIYAGKISNWSQLGGLDIGIIPYQRSEGSGSQSGLYKHVISQDEVMVAPTEQKIGAMDEIIDAVADYDNSERAIGYSYYYYITNMHYQEEVKLLAIDGVYPTMETISAGMYPFISETAAYFRSSEPEGSVVRKIADWCAGAAGNILAEDLGYVPSKTSKTVIPSYAKVEPTQGEWNLLEANNIKIYEVSCKKDDMGQYATAMYFQIEGLKDTKVQDKINARIKEVAEGYLNNPYEPKYIGAALKDATGIHCTGIWCNESFNANNILSITVYASFATPDYTCSYSETKGLNFDLKTGEEIKLADLFDKKTDGIGYINSVIYDAISTEKSEYDYYEDVVLAAPFTGIKENQNYCLNSYNGGLDIIFDSATPEIYSSGYPTYFPVSLQGYFNYDKYLTKKSLFTDESRNPMFLRHDLGTGNYSLIEADYSLIGTRDIWPWSSFMYYDEVDETANNIVKGEQSKLDQITKLAVDAYDKLEKQGYDVGGEIYGRSDLLKVGPYYNATADYSYSVYYSKGEDSGYDSSNISEECCIIEGNPVPLELKDIFRDGVDMNAVLKEAIYNALNAYNLEVAEMNQNYLKPIDMSNPKMDEFVNYIAGNIKGFTINQKSVGLTYKDDIGTLTLTILDDNENWSNYQSALYELTFTEIGIENLNIFD